MVPTHQLKVQAPALNALQDIIHYQVNHHAVYAHKEPTQIKEQALVSHVHQDTTPTKALHHAPNAQPNTPTAKHATTPNASNAKQTTSYLMINRSVRKDARIKPLK